MNASSASIRELFEAAVALEPAARAAFLEVHCADPAIRSRVEALIAADADAAEPFEAGSLDRLDKAIGNPGPAESLPLGSRIGNFQLVEVLGEGGSSTVFHATRDVEGATQPVALKLLRRGLYSPEAQRQFRREQLALIQLRHPNIARMIEGGVTESGLPYIALELVTGPTITDYVREHGLDLRQRLRLFTVVCLAVDAAHRALIVHRDLKPSNVLVNEDGEVKLLDFGIAKLLDEDDGETRTQLPAFTPAYAAPEQREGGAITTATDVYALGVLLGELITGERVNDGSGRTPSSWISAQPGSDEAPVTAPITRRQVRGDLDAIVLKAIDPDPGRRYASAGLLAGDIERLLGGRPVSAHPPSRWYRTRKFLLRHKGGVASTAAFLLAVLAALGIALWQARVAREQARLAHNESIRANATLGFVVDLLKTASADVPKDERPTPELLVREAAKNAREDPDLDPLVRAQLLRTLGEIARTNGDMDNAEALIDDAIARERQLGVAVTAPEWIAAMISKGNLLHTNNRSLEADRLMQALVPEIEAVDTEDAVSALMLYATTRAYARDREKAASLARQALGKAQRVFGADSVNGIETATFLGQLCSNLGRYRDSEAILDEALARWRHLQLPLDEQFARSLFHLAVSKQRLGKRAEVEPLFREGIDLMRRVQEVPNHRISLGLVGYALFLIEEERLEEARKLLDEALVNDKAAFGMDHVRTALTLNALGELQVALQEPKSAGNSIRAAFDILSRRAQAASFEPELARTQLRLGGILLALGQTDEAAARLAAARPKLSKWFGDRSAEVAEGFEVDGNLALSQGDAANALRDSDKAIEQLRLLDIPAPLIEVSSRALRARALLALNRSSEAADEAQRAIERLRASIPAARARLTGLLVLRSRAEYAGGFEDRATQSLAEARAMAVPARLLHPEDRLALQTGADRVR